MPTQQNAVKQLRKDRKRHTHNAALRAELHTVTKKLQILLKGQKLDEAQAVLREVAQKYDRAASKGLVHRNTAARTKSRLTQQINRAKSSR